MAEIEKKRDYDKEPIVIKDYNSLFLCLYMVSFMPLLIIIVIYNPYNVEKDNLFRNLLIIVPLIIYPYVSAYFRAKGKRKIVLENKCIRFLHENILIEKINISDISEIKKTYSDIYHKTQYPNMIGRIGWFISIPLMFYFLGYFALIIFPGLYVYMIFLKYVFHKIKDKSYKSRLYDSIIIYQGENFINILPVTEKDHEEVRNYFFVQGLGDVRNKKIYFEIGHLNDSIEVNKG
jgi:hypothetical protein